jgi:hypothetical protein
MDLYLAYLGRAAQPKQVTHRSRKSKHLVSAMVFDLNKEIRFEQRLFHHLGAVAPLATNLLQRAIDRISSLREAMGYFFFVSRLGVQDVPRKLL